MHKSNGNPDANDLPPELTEADLARAIGESGYPLQLRVAAILATRFRVTEEWSYIDRVTGGLRALDLSATLELGGECPVPSLRLLVECKASRLPYVFFPVVANPSLAQFPQIHGVPGKVVNLSAGFSARRYPVPYVLGLSGERFVSNGPPLCATFSKIVRIRR